MFSGQDYMYLLKAVLRSNEDAMDAAFGGAREDSVLEACMMTAYQNIKEQMNYTLLDGLKLSASDLQGSRTTTKKQNIVCKLSGWD